MKNYIIIILTLHAFCLNVGAQEKLKGRVIDAQTQEPLAGATIKVLSPAKTFVTDNEGYFELSLPKGEYQLAIIYLSYHTKEQSLTIPFAGNLLISLQANENTLKEVNVVSTGYQTLPKERATGSFVLIDNQTLNRSISQNVLDRLEGVSSGLLLNRGLPTQGGANNAKISIHGRSTIFGNAAPLVVVDGFPYEGNIDQLNATDVVNITLLKDAAAASIWGTRASNGVIVITTRSGNKNSLLAINFTSTIAVKDKPNLDYTPTISSASYIDLQQYLFSKGFYNTAINSGYMPISKAVDIFNQRKQNLISNTDSATQINILKSLDVREDLRRYAYRNALEQQYHFALSGGARNNTYYLSGSYNKNLNNAVTNADDRVTLNANNSYSLVKDRVNLRGAINFSSSTNKSKANPYVPYTPFDQLADTQGNSLSVVSGPTLSKNYVDTVGGGKLLDWHFRPKDELVANTTVKQLQYKINLGLEVKIIDGLQLTTNYQFLREDRVQQKLDDKNSFEARNVINRFSTINGDNVSRAIPIGGILTGYDAALESKVSRIQLNYNKTIAINHQLTGIMGFEANDNSRNTKSYIFYGYNPDTKLNGNNTIDPLKLYPYYYAPGATEQIFTAPTEQSYNDFTQSYYVNASYAFKNRYILSGSARRDESNLFGVETNLKSVPLWSAGFAYILSQETFYKLGWLPMLKLRTTYGYNGNVDKNLSGLLTIRNNGLFNEFGSNYARINNPPNPYLRWEKVKTFNVGLDFAIMSYRINGSVDVYQKNAMDLIGNHPIASQSGLAQFKGNGATVLTKGIDLIINSNNISGVLNWKSSLLFNYNIDKVTKYDVKQSSNNNIVTQNFNNPLVGFPYYAIFSYPFAGLDASGSPQGYLNGEVSKNYTAITTLKDETQLKYHGSASPKIFGSLVNSFSFRDFTLSFNLTYKFNYYFKRENVFNGSNYSTAITNFEERWQKSGDEFFTKIPALVYPNNSARSLFYQGSDAVVERGDHVRLQDLKLSYQLNTVKTGGLFKSATVFLYGSNLGILWRKNKYHVDPDVGTHGLPLSFTTAFGINLTL